MFVMNKLKNYYADYNFFLNVHQQIATLFLSNIGYITLRYDTRERSSNQRRKLRGRIRGQFASYNKFMMLRIKI